jgi:hypothetical protein
MYCTYRRKKTGNNIGKVSLEKSEESQEDKYLTREKIISK